MRTFNNLLCILLSKSFIFNVLIFFLSRRNNMKINKKFKDILER